MHVREMIQSSQKVARITQDCETICNETIQYCLEMGSAHTEPSHIQLLQDCADICALTARFASRRSQNNENASTLCADICELCAESCEKLAGDPQMKACANQCLLCAAACHDLERTARAALGAVGARGAGVRGVVHAERHPR